MTDSDRSLLELAAKAVSINLVWSKDASYCYGPTEEGKKARQEQIIWNPLKDDSDAFRLAVKLGILILTVRGFAVANHDDLPAYGGAVRIPISSQDGLEETRRAIVRAAAAIGKGMTEE